MTLIDVGGHKRAEKQLVSSLCSLCPEYAILVLSALSPRVNPEPLQLACAFNLPLIIIITHTDAVSEQRLRDAVHALKAALRQPGLDKVAGVIRSTEEAVLFSVAKISRSSRWPARASRPSSRSRA